MLPQEEYMEKIARKNFDKFYEQGFATAGHNGPHGHLDTPVRNTSHYLIIYCYLYKKYNEERFRAIANKFFSYLKKMQEQSRSGAMHCMITDRFDHLNGLIGQGWVIEALIYFYETFGNIEALEVGKKIFFSQEYNWKKHLWHRIELDGSDIGIDITSNHNVWFAGCSYKLAEYCNNTEINDIIEDFLTEGEHIILGTYKNGLMVHTVRIDDPILKQTGWKNYIYALLQPIKSLWPRKFDLHYIDYGYHIFDLYGYAMLKQKYGKLNLFNGNDYSKAKDLGKDITKILELNKVNKEQEMNKFFLPYNNPSFEWPFVAKANNFYSEKIVEELWQIQISKMYDESTDQMTRNNPDIDTWNARTYEIIRFLES